jgi:hypothetical protein
LVSQGTQITATATLPAASEGRSGQDKVVFTCSGYRCFESNAEVEIEYIDLINLFSPC